MHNNTSKTEQMDDGQDGLVVLGCHWGMAMNLTRDLPVHLRNPPPLVWWHIDR